MDRSGIRWPAGGAVVIGSVSDATKEKLAGEAAGAGADVSGSPPTLVIEAQGQDPRALCRRINRVVGSEAVVAPLLTDDDGHRLIPTGRLQVRFEKPLADEALAALSRRHQVTPFRRNRWSPQQVEFSVRSDDERFLPDIAAAIAEDRDVAAAWLDVRAAFRRLRA